MSNNTTAAAASLILGEMSLLFKYSPAQLAQFNWAADGIKDHLAADWDDVAPEIVAEGDLKKWLLAELKYRLTEQLREMAAGVDPRETKASIHAAQRAWRFIESVVMR